LRQSNQRPGDQQESSCDSCEWTPLYKRRAFRNAQVQRCGSVAPCSEVRAKLLGESAERKKDFSEISAYRNSITRRGNRRHAAEQRYERASLHSITSSARTSRVGGISIPTALAVLRLITNSNLVGCWTGRSAGFSPLRISDRHRHQPDDGCRSGL